MNIADTFDYVEDYPGQDQTLIRIKTGQFEGMIFRFGTIRLNEKDGNQLDVKLDYQVIEAPITVTADQRLDFEKEVTAILHYLLQNRNSIT